MIEFKDIFRLDNLRDIGFAIDLIIRIWIL